MQTLDLNEQWEMKRLDAAQWMTVRSLVDTY